MRQLLILYCSLLICFIAFADAESDFNEGYKYHSRKEYKQALEYFTKSADQGNPEAQSALGVLFYYGEGIKQNFKKAVYWYEKSAEQGNANAQYNLGSMYCIGNSLFTIDFKKARYWFRKAAEQGNTQGKLFLEMMTVLGQGTLLNYKERLKYLSDSEKLRNAASKRGINTIRLLKAANKF